MRVCLSRLSILAALPPFSKLANSFIELYLRLPSKNLLCWNWITTCRGRLPVYWYSMFHIVQACAKMTFERIYDGLQRLRLPIAYVYCLEEALFMFLLHQKPYGQAEGLCYIFDICVVSKHLCSISTDTEDSFVNSGRVCQPAHCKVVSHSRTICREES